MDTKNVSEVKGNFLKRLGTNFFSQPNIQLGCSTINFWLIDFDANVSSVEGGGGGGGGEDREIFS